ncbi:TPA: hypothetical protein G8N50_004761, partial [Salmonella enterica]|nr:hypothetical protein [Salmonella enterica]
MLSLFESINYIDFLSRNQVIQGKNMKIENINGIRLTGLSVRTTNVQESHASTAKIAGLWEKFMAEVSPELSDNSEVYGVYTNYASDFTGAFDVVACASHLSPEKSDN